MTESCCPVAEQPADSSQRYRRVLWIALALNVSMFAVELAASVMADSTSLMADAVDFAGDAANYGLSLGALALGAVWQSRVALFKGASMAAYGLFVLTIAAWRLVEGSAPEPSTMSAIALLALLVNVVVAVLLFSFRNGNANMRSVWLCTRNDVVGNIAVLVAAAGVFGTGNAWPDLAVAAILASLGLSSGIATVRLARRELTASSNFQPEALRSASRR
ncbi:MAG: cation transporter [Burkholderiaceae bacterium]